MMLFAQELVWFDGDMRHSNRLAVNLCGYVATSGTDMYLANPSEDRRYSQDIDYLTPLKKKKEAMKDLYAIPLKRAEDDRVVGVVE